jgi:hypothetical protein
VGGEGVKEKEEGEVSRSPTPAAVPIVQATLPPTVYKGKAKDPGWVKSSRGNMSLMTEEKRSASVDVSLVGYKLTKQKRASP